MPSASRLCRSSSWSAIEPAAAEEPKSERPKRAPSSSAQLTSRTVSGGVPSSASRRSTSTPAITFKQPSSQPPFGTESMCPPMSNARPEEPLSVNHWFPAASTLSSAPVSATFSRSQPRARSHVSVHATRCAPFSSPVSCCSSRSSATVREGSSGMGRLYNCDMHSGMAHAQRVSFRAGMLVVVLATLWGLWEGWHWIGTHFHLTWPFEVNDITMPHLHRIVQALFEPAQVNGPWLIDILWHASLFTAKESIVGFVLGAVFGFAIAVILSQSRFLERGFIPYIVASQTIPLLAIAPMVVVGLGTKGVTDWVSVAVLAAYLTFFPVTINVLRGLQSADPRAVELMRSYAANRWTILWKLPVPSSLPYLFAGFRVAAPLAIV